MTPHDADRPSIDALSDTLGAILSAARGLPRFALHPEERMRLAGSTFWEAPELVDAMCRAVEEGGDLFADVPFDPAAARRGVDRARWYQRFGCALRRLARRADDLALFEQAEATRAALSVLAVGRCRLAEPFSQARARRLHHALRPAEEVLERRHAKSRGAALATARAAAGAPAAGQPRRRPSGARRRAAARPRFFSDDFLRRLDASARSRSTDASPPPAIPASRAPAPDAAGAAPPTGDATLASMKLLDRLANLVKSNLNAAIDSVSDPAKEIDLLVEQMEEEQKRGRVELRDHLAQEKLAQKKAEEAYRNVQRWQEHAERAALAGDDELAKEALRRQAEAEKAQEDVERGLSEQSRLVAQLTQRLKDNDKKLAEIKGRKETLKARARAAKQSLSIEGNAFDRFDQLAGQIEMSEHQADAMRDMAMDPDLNPRLQGRDRDTEEKFARLLPGKTEKDQEVEDRLAELKARLDKR